MSNRKPPAGEGYDVQSEYIGKYKPFWFRWADQWWELPHARMLDFGAQLMLAEFETSAADLRDRAQLKQAVDDLFATIMGDEQAAEWAKVEARPLNMLLDTMNRWTTHFEVDEGESSASDGSSTSTGRPSKRTSNGSTASASPKPSSRRARKTATARVNSSSGSEG